MNVQENYEKEIIDTLFCAEEGVDKLLSIKEDILKIASKDYRFWYKIMKSIQRSLQELDKVIPTLETMDQIINLRFKSRVLIDDLNKIKPVDTAPWYKRMVRRWL
jgi:hypothetical protein